MDFYVASPVLPFHPAAGAAFASFTSKQDISPQPLPVIRAGQFHIGSKVWVKACGEYSSLTGAALTLGLWIGTATGTITVSLAETSVFTTGTTPAAWSWDLEWMGTIVTHAVSGSVVGQGLCNLGSSLTAVTATPFPITQALRTVTVDTTIDRAIGVSATWGASSASNTIKTNELIVMLLN
jgi:hypothetical protein